MAKKEHGEPVGEMKHAGALLERLFVFCALPNLQDMGKVGEQNGPQTHLGRRGHPPPGRLPAEDWPC